MSAGEVVRRLAVLADTNPEGVVAFDADGTLWQGDVGEDFLRYVLYHASPHVEVERRVAELARAHGIAAGGGAKAGLRALWEAYEQGRFPEEAFCEMISGCAAGCTRAEVETLARASVASDLVARLTRELCPVLQWAGSRGSVAWVVSASPAFVVRAALAVVGERVPVAPERVVAFEPRWDGAVMAAQVRRPLPYGEGKVACLRARLGGRPLLGAFGDSGSDAPLLGAAKLGVAVRPKRSLTDARVPGVLLLEP